MATLKHYGYPGHFIGAKNCRLHLCTEVNNRFLVSTVGAYWVNGARERLGAGDTDFFETCVFTLGHERCTDPKCGCDMPVTANWCEIEGIRASTPGEATDNHERLVVKYSRMPS